MGTDRTRDSAADAASRVIAKFGGQSALARALGTNQSTVQHWAKTRQIPSWRHEEILRAAQERGVPLERAELTANPQRLDRSGSAAGVFLPQPGSSAGMRGPGPQSGPGALGSGPTLFFAGARPPQGGLQHGQAAPIPAADPELAAIREELRQLRQAITQLADEVRKLREERGGATPRP
jgi:DNA-binding transcriptional regulator YdaS (Cro superfamily)